MSQINPYYEFTVLKLLPKACPIPVPDDDQINKPVEVIHTDGVLIELTDAMGEKCRLTIHRTTFPIFDSIPDMITLKPGSTGFLSIESTGNLCINLNDFE